MTEALAATNTYEEEEKTTTVRKFSVDMNQDFDSRLCNQVDLLLDPNTDSKPFQINTKDNTLNRNTKSSDQSPAALKKFKQSKKKKKRRPQDFQDLEFRHLRSRTETPSKEEPKLPQWPFGGKD